MPIHRNEHFDVSATILLNALAMASGDTTADATSFAARVGRALCPARYRRKQSRKEQEMARQMAEVPVAPPPGRSLRRLHGLEGSRKDFGDVMGSMGDGDISQSAKRLAVLGASMAGNMADGALVQPAKRLASIGESIGQSIGVIAGSSTVPTNGAASDPVAVPGLGLSSAGLSPAGRRKGSPDRKLLPNGSPDRRKPRTRKIRFADDALGELEA